MPGIYEFKCDKCDFEMPEGWGRYMYVLDKEGKKIICPHPSEYETALEVLNIEGFGAWNCLFEFPIMREENMKLFKERTGVSFYCVCLKCLNQFDIDIERDKKICPKCKSNKIKTEEEMIGQKCPKCKIGVVREIDTGLIT